MGNPAERLCFSAAGRTMTREEAENYWQRCVAITAFFDEARAEAWDVYQAKSRALTEGLSLARRLDKSGDLDCERARAEFNRAWEDYKLVTKLRNTAAEVADIAKRELNGRV